jgi:pimeloyl-ACP methyl ester carboxylesterase
MNVDGSLRVSPPPLRNLFREARSFTEWMGSALWMNIEGLPEGDGHGVLLLPGFLASDRSLAPLARVLRRLNYRTYRSGLNINPGPTKATVEWLQRRVPEVLKRSGGPISIVGQSLGGIYAREIARRAHGEVRMVITMGSPFRDPDSTRATVLASRLRGWWHPEEAHHGPHTLGRPLAVPTTSIYSRTDGIVPWRACLEEDGPRRENIEVNTSHIGMSAHPAVIRIVADRLAQRPACWRPYRPDGSTGGSAVRVSRSGR